MRWGSSFLLVPRETGSMTSANLRPALALGGCDRSTDMCPARLTMKSSGMGECSLHHVVR